MHATLHDRPINSTHRSTRTLAEHIGLGATTIRRVWHCNGLKPHLSRTFKLSRDPLFEDKLLDVVGLYLNPPEHALVLSCDEKSQLQALNRTKPGLPMKRGRAGTAPHDYKRHGATTLFTALNTLDGSVISMCQPPYRHSEWVEFLRLIERHTLRHLSPHLIVDNYARHSHPDAQKWLERHPRFVMHFTPHQHIVAEHGRALLPRHYRQAYSQGQLHQRGRTRIGYRPVRRSSQHRPEAAHLDRMRVRHLGQGDKSQGRSHSRCRISTEQSGVLAISPTTGRPLGGNAVWARFHRAVVEASLKAGIPDLVAFRRSR